MLTLLFAGRLKKPDVRWLLEEGGVVPTAAMQVEVALQRGLLGLEDGEQLDHDRVEDLADRGQLLRHAVHTTRRMEATMAAWQLDMAPPPPTSYALTPTSKCQAWHVFIDTKGLCGMMRDAGMLGVLTEEGVASVKNFGKELPRMGKHMSAVNPLAHLDAEWLGVDSCKEEEEEDYSGIHRRALQEELPPGARPAPTNQAKEETTPLTRIAHLGPATKTWLAQLKPQLNALSHVSSKPCSLASYQRFADTVMAMYDVMWAEAKQRWPDRVLTLAYGAAGFSGNGSVGSRGVPVSQMLKEALRQFPAGRVLMVDEFRTSRWLRPVYSKAKRSQVRGLMSSTSNNISRPSPRPTELCYWEGRPALPKPGQPGQEWVYLPNKALL
ncbi:hypothetical protein QJQ45_016499, partial [Haematococcus lacustris]